MCLIVQGGRLYSDFAAQASGWNWGSLPLQLAEPQAEGNQCILAPVVGGQAVRKTVTSL